MTQPGIKVRQSSKWARVSPTELAHIAVLVGLCLLLFVTGLGSRPLWNQDEGMHAATSKDMVLTGDWITPRVNGEPFFDKPAFHSWLVAVSFLTLGFTELAARLPNALMALATVLATYFLGRQLYGPRTGLVAGAVLATAGEFFVLSRTVMHDISLGFFVTLGLTLFFFGYSEGGGRRRWFLLACAAFAGAVLAKGPAGVIVPAGVVLLFLAIRRDLGFLRRQPLGWGALIGVVITAPWYLAIGLSNADYARYFFIELNLGSFFSKASHHPAPIYYYLPVLLGGFLPWSPLLPIALRRAWRRRAEGAAAGTLFLILWAGVYLVFFSLAQSKLSTYILPAFPALALVIGRLWNELFSESDKGLARVAALSFIPVALIPIAVGTLLVSNPSPDYLTRYGISLGLAAAPLLALAFGLALVAVLLAVGRARSAFGAAILSAACCYGLFLSVVVPAMNEHQTTVQIAREMDDLVPRGEALTFVGSLRDSALFYTDRHVRLIPRGDAAGLVAFLGSTLPAYCVIERTALADMAIAAYVVLEIGDDLLIANRPVQTRSTRLAHREAARTGEHDASGGFTPMPAGAAP